MSDVERRLERVEALLRLVLERIRGIEERLSREDLEGAWVAHELAYLLSAPVAEALEAARRFASPASRLRLDPISRDVVKVLSLCEEMSVSEVTKALRGLRGSASRRVVRRRLDALEGYGVVVNVGTRERPRFVLRSCLEGRRDERGA